MSAKLEAAAAEARCGLLEIRVELKQPNRIKSVNQNFLGAFGFLRGEIIGRSLRLLNGPCTDITLLHSLLKNAALQTECSEVISLYDHEGERLVVKVNVVNDCVCCAENECVLRMQTLEVLQSKAAFADDGSKKLIIRLDNGRIEHVSESFEKSFGFLQSQMQGRTLSLIQGPSTDICKLASLIQAGRCGYYHSEVLTTCDAKCEEITSLVKVAPVLSGQNSTLAFIQLSFSDVPVDSSADDRDSTAVAESLFPSTYDYFKETLSQVGNDFRSSMRAAVASASQRVKEMYKEQCMLESQAEKQWRIKKLTTLVLLAVPAIAMLPVPRMATASSAQVMGPHSLGSSEKLFQGDNSMKLYREFVPPTLRGRQNVRYSDVHLRKPVKAESKQSVLMLDLDKTSIYGNDGNDLGIALQWMDKPEPVVKELYRHLVNPNVRQAYDNLHAQSRDTRVVIYTRRPQVLHYRSCFRDATINVKYNEEWHSEGQLYIPSEISNAQEMMNTYQGPELLEDEANDVSKSLERLIAARDAIAQELGLTTPPVIVVTASDKRVTDTAEHLGLSSEHAYLFDDNEALRKDPKVIVVEPTESLPASRRDELLAFLENNLPASQLEEELVEYLEGARPGEQSIQRDPQTGAVSWFIPMAAKEQASWEVPNLPDSAWERAMSKGFNAPPWMEEYSSKDGSLSPITPAEGATNPISLRRTHVDLKAAAERAVLMREAGIESVRSV
uniref:PAS domain-containing protein n=1 Tax=Hanusia phi TaxID=3032 RepID=A0A7S0F5D2_9CRYP|mmetsp:Transcript_36787/g.82907  ORF Transcript_36787/g.82907 Transcript_36787/m.82907 type:complete len:727 (+) Transcript_36787:211-2391(+)|eukprot:757021-Hanusia_phi.AAC.3